LSFDKKRVIPGRKRGNAAKLRGLCLTAALSFLAAGCASQNAAQIQPEGLAAPKKNVSAAKHKRSAFAKQAMYRDDGRLTERSCLERAMFFESNHASRDGLIAVGTVVMNRVHSSEYPNTICGVVGQKSQFAPGVLTRRMDLGAAPQVAAAADAVLRGERSRRLKNAMYFHTAGLRFSYNNMHYVLVAGGNSFYEKRRSDGSLINRMHDEIYDVAYAYAQDRGEILPASAALNGAAGAESPAVELASAEGPARVEPAVYRSGPAGGDMVAAANASLKTAYDNDRRPAEAPAAGKEAQAVLASYAPVPAAVPVPQPKIESAAAAEAEPARNETGPVQNTPHFMPISAPGSADFTGSIPEIGGSEKNVSLSYKAPDEEQAGQVGAMLLSGK